MLSPPPGFTDEDLTAALAEHWGVRGRLTYRPVGFGSHHWTVGTDWFATVDEDPDFRQLEAALRSAADVPVAVAPVPARSGAVVVRQGRFAVALYPFVAGESFEWGDYRDDEHRRAALDLVLAVHRTPPRHALTDTFKVPDLAKPGNEGPYSQPAARLLAEHEPSITALRIRHEALAAKVDRTRLVLTHGEPHAGKTMRTQDGWRLIDWDTALVAPPERDLWHLATPETLAEYENATGVHPDEDMLTMYRLRWTLTDLTEFTTRFATPRTATPDTEKSWHLLRTLVTTL